MRKRYFGFLILALAFSLTALLFEDRHSTTNYIYLFSESIVFSLALTFSFYVFDKKGEATAIREKKTLSPLPSLSLMFVFVLSGAYLVYCMEKLLRLGFEMSDQTPEFKYPLAFFGQLFIVIAIISRELTKYYKTAIFVFASSALQYAAWAYLLDGQDRLRCLVLFTTFSVLGLLSIAHKKSSADS